MGEGEQRSEEYDFPPMLSKSSLEVVAVEVVQVEVVRVVVVIRGLW